MASYVRSGMENDRRIDAGAVTDLARLGDDCHLTDGYLPADPGRGRDCCAACHSGGGRGGRSSQGAEQLNEGEPGIFNAYEGLGARRAQAGRGIRAADDDGGRACTNLALCGRAIREAERDGVGPLALAEAGGGTHSPVAGADTGTHAAAEHRQHFGYANRFAECDDHAARTRAKVAATCSCVGAPR